MNYRDHNPPHFHARYGDFKAGIRINDLGVMVGNLPPKALGLIIEWATIHKEELMKNWIATKEKIQLSPIEPLK